MMPILALRDNVVFPGMVVNLDIGRSCSINAVRIAMETDKKLFLATQTSAKIADPEQGDLYPVGTVAVVKQLLKLPGGTMRILVEGVTRASLQDVTEQEEPAKYLEGTLAILAEDLPSDELAEVEALRRLLLDAFEKWTLTGKQVNAEVLMSFKNNPNSGQVADSVAGFLDTPLKEKAHLLGMINVKKRMQTLYGLLTKELEISGLEKEIEEQVRQEIEKSQKEYYLREKIKVLHKELGEGEDVRDEAQEYKEKIKQCKLPEELQKIVLKEADRLGKMPPLMPESAVIRNYLDVVLGLPWGKMAAKPFDIKQASIILDQHHYGLEKVKERILEYLAVRKLTHSNKGPILCLVGPPGVGKSTLAKSVAEAINRPFTRMSLGGIRDEAEIRGHRRTYIGAMPGRIMRGISLAGCLDPVFLLDEIDKVSSDYKGDPTAALLEVLDPEQNNTFSDHFVDYPFDLSNVFWIITANTVESIPAPLLDRVEIIQLNSYTEDEKHKIGELYLLPKEMKAHGLTDKMLTLTPTVMRHVIRDYTREPGVRNLERQLAKLCRKTDYKIVTEGIKSNRITLNNLPDYLGQPMPPLSYLKTKAEAGIVTGMAVTGFGGDILQIEALITPGRGMLHLTGKLGDVMKESAQASCSFVRSRCKQLGLKKDFFDHVDIHIHVPEGAVPKDGPSAGVGLVTAMVSAATGRKVKANFAMTGEITLSGRVLAVGGIKEKVLAALRYGITNIIMPKAIEGELQEVPLKSREKMHFFPVEHVDEVLDKVLED